MRKFLFLSLLICFNSNLFAETYSSDSLIPCNSATIQILDKPSGKTKTFNLELNKTYKIDRLVLNVRNCFKTPEYTADDNMAFLQIDKTHGGIEGKYTNIFSGWMYKTMPGQNPLTDETYDLWLLKCE